MSLARMSRVELPIPLGFCVSSMAYREHLNSDNPIGQLQEALAKLEQNQFEEKRKLCPPCGTRLLKRR